MGDTRLTWTSGQLADLAGVTVRTLRHYHQIGLLPEPNRTAGGYRAYGPAHALMVLRIRRLVAAGLSLAQIAELLTFPDQVRADQALQELDRQLAEQIALLEEQRRAVASLMGAGRLDLPPRYAAQVSSLSGIGYDEAAMAEVKDLVELVEGLGEKEDREILGVAIDQLGAQATPRRLMELDQEVRQIDESTPEDVVDRLVTEVTALTIEFAERGMAQAAEAGIDVSVGVDLTSPTADLLLAWAEAGLNPRAQEAFQRVLAKVTDHFGANSPPPARHPGAL
jgi:DNA-binding transcriptional MerR regulator